MPRTKPNVVFILADQLRADALPMYGGDQVATPHLQQLAEAGVTFTNAVSTFPVCAPYCAMLMTGRHPSSTGHWVNFLRLRHDEIGIADAFAAAGYRTGYVGKWHLHTGSFPGIDARDYVPAGRDRLGFEHWRGYNFHRHYFNGWIHTGTGSTLSAAWCATPTGHWPIRKRPRTGRCCDPRDRAGPFIEVERRRGAT